MYNKPRSKIDVWSLALLDDKAGSGWRLSQYLPIGRGVNFISHLFRYQLMVDAIGEQYRNQ